MMFWQESGRRAKAERERDAIVAELEKVRKERDKMVAAAVNVAVKEAVRSASAQERAALE